MTTLNDTVLGQSSLDRFIAAANYKHSFFYIAVTADEELNLMENAELINIEPYNITPYTGRAVFRMDRLANGVPFGEVTPTKQFFDQHVLIKQITGQDIVNTFGINGVVYMDLGISVPPTTKLLAGTFQSRFGLVMTPSDIQDQVIPPGARCIVVRFNAKSVGYKGSLRVDLTTPVLPTTGSA
jgi:hypothetical protein